MPGYQGLFVGMNPCIKGLVGGLKKFFMRQKIVKNISNPGSIPRNADLKLLEF